MVERIAKSLGTLRDQINAAAPLRSKTSDGWIGDARHRANKSDHNPNEKDHVLALDITHDLDERGDDFDAWKLAETLRLNRDPRISYVISNGRIVYSYGKQPWQWQAYNGKNKHSLHTHVSAVGVEAQYDDPRPWIIDHLPPGAVVSPKPVVPPPPGVTLPMRQRMGRLIVNYEARRNAAGHPSVFTAPDGTLEIAGINATHHRAKVLQLKALLEAGKHDEVERVAAEYVVGYTKAVTGWVTDAGLEFYLRDCCFNRGPTGAAMILQLALGFTGKGVDGEIGPASRQRLADTGAVDLLQKLRAAREKYEDWKYPARRASKQWQGMLNRWNNSLADAKKFQAEGAPVTPVAKTTSGTAVAGGAAGAAAAASEGIDITIIVLILVIGLSLGLVAWKLWPRGERSALT